MLKALMISLVLTGGGEAERNPYYDDKPFDTLEECLALKYQNEFTQRAPFGYEAVKFICIMVKEV